MIEVKTWAEKKLEEFENVLQASDSQLVEGYSNNYDAVDWYIRELNCIIELHGKQHYEQVKFSNNNSFFKFCVASKFLISFCKVI